MTYTATMPSVTRPSGMTAAQTEERVATARRYLQHKADTPFDVADDGLVRLAADLKQMSKFTYARRILFKLRNTNPQLKESLREEHALCAYKDKDLPADRRFDMALRILAKQEDHQQAEIDVQTLMRTESIETLGQVGSIFRRLWERDLDRRHLQLAYAFYRRGYSKALADPVGKRSMLAWTGINASFVLELIAREETAYQTPSIITMVDRPTVDLDTPTADVLEAQDKERFRRQVTLRSAEDEPTEALDHDQTSNRVSLREAARHIRAELIETLEGPTDDMWKSYQANREHRKQKTEQETSPNDQQQDADLWWLMSTLGEAYFGIGRPGSAEWEKARDWFKRAGDVSGIQQWHLESTTRRIAQLAQIHAAAEFPQTVDDFDRQTATGSRRTSSRAERFTESDWGQVLTPFLGENRSEAVSSAFRGKVGLALSGGGFRASLFHLGVLAKLAELDILRHIEVISCVSGGSILGACYYLKLRRLLEAHGDAALAKLGRQTYIDLVSELIDEFLTGVQKNLRTKLLTNPLSNIRMIFDPRYTRTERAADLLEKDFFRRVDHLPGADLSFGERLKTATLRRERWHLRDLNVEPADATGSEANGKPQFHPRYDNWLRANKVPMLIVNASTLNTGHNWQFTGGWMGEPPGRIATEVDANDRLRRLYFKEAPVPYQHLRLGSAVAASACVPGLFEPITFTKLYEKEHVVRLVDGGVYDNQGVGALLEEDCNVVLISDASGQMTSDTNPPDGMLGVPLRANTILMERVRQAQFNELDARKRAGLLQQLMFVHLTKDLDMAHIDWLDCPEPADPSFDRPPNPLPGRTSYHVNEEIQRALSSTRTDLDSFTDIEAYALMTSGYQMADRYVPPGFGSPLDNSYPWRFLTIAPFLDTQQPAQQLLRHLQTARHRFLRLPRYLNDSLGGWLKRVSVAGAFFVALFLGTRAVTNTIVPARASIDLPVGALFRTGLATLVILGLLAASPRFRRWFPAFVMRAVLGTAGFLISWAHLLTFNWIYHKIGSMKRLS